MSYNGSGTFNINSTGQPVVTGTAISSTVFNAFTADIGTGLSTALTKDGQTVATARIPFAAGINSSLVTDATNTTTGSIITAGGVGVAKALFVGTTANIAGTTTLAGVTATSITDSGLTSGRVTFASTAGLLADAAALAWDGTSLSATKFAGALNGTVGATTPSTGAFTTISATGSVTATAPANSLAVVINGRSSDNLGALYYYANNGSTQYATIIASATELQFSSVPAAAIQTFKTNGTERMRIDSSGNVEIGITTAAPAKFTISGQGGSNVWLQSNINTGTGAIVSLGFSNDNGLVGYIQTSGSSTSYVTSSDYRLKQHIQPMIGALAKVAQLKPVTYKWKVDGSNGQGFIAHELQEVVPDCVSGEKDATREEEYEVIPAVPAVVDAEGVETTPAVQAVKGTRIVPSYQGVDTSFLVATLTAAIQELKAIIDTQATRIAALEEK